MEDAQILWNAGRLEGAFVSALIAVAATARRSFPSQKSDRQAFEDFLDQGWFKKMHVEYRGDLHPMCHIFYKWFRCELIHEGELPVDVEIVPDSKPGLLGIRAGGAPEFVLQVSQAWFHELVGTVIRADVNRELLHKQSENSSKVN
ncbi:MAG: hypothetical protein ABSG10_04395 [Terracidiphilus sp.]